jgi:hypothetical protein
MGDAGDFHPIPEEETDPFSEMLCSFVFLRILDVGQNPKIQ